VKHVAIEIIVDIPSSNLKRLQIHIDPAQCLEIPAALNAIGKIVVLAEITDMSVSSEELHGSGWKMAANGGEEQVVFKSGAVSKWCVSDHDYEVYIMCFMFEHRLKPALIDEFMRRLANRHKFIVAFGLKTVSSRDVPVKSKRTPNARMV
jgi:hypothetical protein